MAENTATDVSNIESEPTATEEDSDVITMVEFLEEEQKLEDEVHAVLGGSDDKNCTYSKGYMKRQAVYSCLTCIPKATNAEPGGVCLACSYSCHEGHDLVELYTKRDFKCDCGNSRFLGKKCNLFPDKDDVNKKNTYNQNYFGKYCTCHRPYPDPKQQGPVDDMIQCLMCEDWFHSKHIHPQVRTTTVESGELVCRACVARHQFLKYYNAFVVTDDVKVTVDEDGANNSNEKSEQKPDQKPEQEVDKGCYTSIGEVVPHNSALFFVNGWRNKLCSCPTCLQTYEDEGVSYLMDHTDPVQAYEASGTPPVSQYEQGLAALSSLDRVNQIEAIGEFNNMKNQLKEYLKTFADNGVVVQEEDIRDFFAKMEAQKKPRLNDLPEFCR